MGFLPSLQTVQGCAFLRECLPHEFTDENIEQLQHPLCFQGCGKTLCFAMENRFGCFEYELLELEMPWVLMEEADGCRVLWKM